jgi:hypothetical protein
MENAPSYSLLQPAAPVPARWGEIILPKEHGSWALALEPIAIGLLVAPSLAGAWFSLAVIAAFFARRPLRLLANGRDRTRRSQARRAAGACASISLLCLAASIASAGVNWLGSLLPSITAGAFFLHFDLRGAGREETAEIAGAAAFAFVPSVLATLAGWPGLAALALALIVAGRSVPSVMFVRAYLRAAKTGVHRVWPALIAAALALALGAVAAAAQVAPAAALGMLALFAVRGLILLVFLRPRIRARALGWTEAALGGLWVVVTALAWRA